MRRMEQTPSTAEETTEDTITMKRSHFYSVLVVFAFTVGILFGYVIWGRTSQSQQTAQLPAGAQQPAAQAPAAPAPAQDESDFTRYDIPIDGFPSLGPDDAKIVIVEFSDYQ